MDYAQRATYSSSANQHQSENRDTTASSTTTTTRTARDLKDSKNYQPSFNNQSISSRAMSGVAGNNYNSTSRPTSSLSSNLARPPSALSSHYGGGGGGINDERGTTTSTSRLGRAGSTGSQHGSVSGGGAPPPLSTVLKTPGGAARYGGLKERDLKKITSSIRTASRNANHHQRSSVQSLYSDRASGARQEQDGEGDEDDDLDHDQQGNEDNELTRLGTAANSMRPSDRLPVRSRVPEGAFISESSFRNNPLMSRLPPASPRRPSASYAPLPPSEDRKGKGKKSRRTTINGLGGGGGRGEESENDDEELSSEAERRLEANDDDVSDDSLFSLPEETAEERRLKKLERREGLRDKEPLKALSLELQEALIVEDLLFVLMGIEGQYIEFDPSYTPEDDYERLQGALFCIDPELDPSLTAATERFLPLATYYTSLGVFVDQYSALEYGVINHALCATMRDMLKDYLVLLAQLEQQFLTSPEFSLNKLWFYLDPTVHSLSLLHALTSELLQLNLPSSNDDSNEKDPDDKDSDDEDDDDDDDFGLGQNEGMKDILAQMKGAKKGISNSAPGSGPNNLRNGRAMGVAKGGEILYVISELLSKTSGDPVAFDLYSHLLLRASQPYVTILLGWITSGVLKDPWEEFIVKEGKGITRGSLDMDYTDEYWERRYTLRDKGVQKSNGAPGVTSGLSQETPRQRGLVGGAIIPSFLEPWKNKILLAGKYLNVIRECGIEVRVPDGTNVKPLLPNPEEAIRAEGALTGELTSALEKKKQDLIAMNEERFYKRIDNAYTYANKTLLKLLLEEQHLVSRLRSLKQYFFIDYGDAFTHFLDLAKHELKKKKKHASLSKLQSLLDLALRAPSSSFSNASNSINPDPFREDLKVSLGNSTLTEWLVKIVNVSGTLGSNQTTVGGAILLGEDGSDPLGNGMLEEGKREEAAKEEEKAASNLLTYEAFTLDYTVKFPLSLVISRKTILRYQLLFRHLLQLKHLERALADTWTEHTKSPLWRKRTPYPELEQWKGRVFALRARMFAFVQQMYGFAVSGVLEPNWKKLEAKLEKVETVDQLLRDHVDFLDTCLKECLLTNEKLLILHANLLKACTLFASYTSHFTKSIAHAQTAIEAADGDWAQVPFQKQWDFLSSFERNFNHHTKSQLERISYHSSRENAALLPLVVRLTNLKIPVGAL